MAATAKRAPVVRTLGTPVKSINWVRLYAGRNAAGAPLLLASMGQDAGGLFVCDIDLATGHCTQHAASVRTQHFPTAAFLVPTTGVLYIGGAYGGNLFRYDPNRPAAERCLEDLGKIYPPQPGTFPCRIDQAPDGCLYIGAYPDCSLTRFDPATGAFTQFGRMDPTDMYFYPLCGADGTVAGLVQMCRPHLVALDPQTGHYRPVGPVFDKQAEGKVDLDFYKGADGLLYLRSAKGNFRVQGLDVMPVSELPPAAPAPNRLPDGTAVAMADSASFNHRRVRLTPPVGGGAARELALDWVGDGTTIFLVHLGPDGRLYGSSILPEHLFSCALDGSGMTDHGQCSVSGGEAYSMGNLDGKLYLSSYPAARLSVYDPAQPYRFGTDEGANPRDLGPSDPVSYRPRTMVAGPAGKVWIGSVPDYGLWGGTLVNYDPRTGQFAVHRHVVQDCSVTALAWVPDPGVLVVGTAIEAGSGAQPKATAAQFVLWDVERDAPTAADSFGVEALRGVLALCAAGPGQCYAVVVLNRPPSPGHQSLVSAELLLLDLRTRRVLDRSPFGEADGWPLEVSLQPGPVGAVYGATRLAFYRIAPGSAQRTVLHQVPLAQEDQWFCIPGPIVGHTFYFANRCELRALDFGPRRGAERSPRG